MSSLNIDNETYKSLRESSLLEKAEPSAPMYSLIISEEPERDSRKKEDTTACKNTPIMDPEPSPTARMLRIQLDLKKAQIMREQLEKERLAMEVEFKAKKQLLEAKLELAVASLDEMALHETRIDQSTQSLGSNAVEALAAKLLQETCSPNNSVASVTASSAEYQQLQDLAFLNERQIPFNPQVVTGLPINAKLMPVAGDPSMKLLGLDMLKVLDSVTVRQLPSPQLRESYEVLAEAAASEGDMVVLRVTLHPGIAGVGLPSQKRVMKADFMDKDCNEVGAYRLSSDAMDLFFGQQLVAKVRRAKTFLKPMLVICNCFAQPTLKIKGSKHYSEIHQFSVQTASKMSVGSISKRPGRPTLLRFPLDLDVRFKLALIASSFHLVDQQQREARELKLHSVNATRVHYFT